VLRNATIYCVTRGGGEGEANRKKKPRHNADHVGCKKSKYWGYRSVCYVLSAMKQKGKENVHQTSRGSVVRKGNVGIVQCRHLRWTEGDQKNATRGKPTRKKLQPLTLGSQGMRGLKIVNRRKRDTTYSPL